MMELYIFCLLFYLAGADEVTVDGKTNGDITVRCSNKNRNPYCIWQRQSSFGQYEDIKDIERDKYKNKETFRMTIKSFNFADRGSYRCKCFDRTKSYQYSSSMTIDLADIHTEHRLDCGHTGLYYIWKRKQGSRYENIVTSSKYTTNKSSQLLTLLQVGWNADGIYRCAYYDNKWFDVEFYLIVQDIKLPMIYLPKSQYVATIGDDIFLKCTFGQTLPKTTAVWWTKFNNGRYENIPSSNEQKYQGGVIQSISLNISSVTESDSGEYRCNGQNTNGQKFVFTQLTIENPPVVNISQECYVLRVGDNVTIGVTVKNAPPGSSMNWRQGRNNIYNSIRQTIGELRNPFLTIRHVELKDAGNYTLSVQNTYGNHSSFTVLKVVSATIKGYKGYRQLDKTANDSLIIECEVSGGTTVTWRQNGKQLKGVNQLSLQINKITRLNKGNYTCETNLETVTSKSSILQLNVKDIPWVSLPHETKEVIKGSDTVLDCSYDSYPKPTRIYWKKDDDIIKHSNTFNTTYNGSSVEISVLVLHDTNQSDAGNYVCVVENSIGTGYSKILQITIKDTPSSERKEYAYEKPLITSLSVIGIILVFVGLIVCYKRRQRNNSHYESPDFKQGDVHRYSTARNADEYDLPITTDDVNTLRTSGSLDKRNELKENRSFTVHEFLQLFNDTDKFKRHVQLEYKNLTESYKTNKSGGEYYNETASFMTHKNPLEHNTYLNTALTIKENCTLFISSVPQSNSIGQFWKFVSKNGVEQIILLTKENQQFAAFYPVSDTAIEMKYLRLELDSSEKKNTNLFLFHLQLKNQDKKSSTPVKIYKTTNWKETDRHLPLEILSQLLDVTRSSKSKSALLMTNDELAIGMAGILKVCTDVFRAIDDSSSFSVFQLAKVARNQHPMIFQEKTDYELCYLLIQHHLEGNHLYDAID